MPAVFAPWHPTRFSAPASDRRAPRGVPADTPRARTTASSAAPAPRNNHGSKASTANSVPLKRPRDGKRQHQANAPGRQADSHGLADEQRDDVARSRPERQAHADLMRAPPRGVGQQRVDRRGRRAAVRSPRTRPSSAEELLFPRREPADLAPSCARRRRGRPPCTRRRASRTGPRSVAGIALAANQQCHRARSADRVGQVQVQPRLLASARRALRKRRRVRCRRSRNHVSRRAAGSADPAADRRSVRPEPPRQPCVDDRDARLRIERFGRR